MSVIASSGLPVALALPIAVVLLAANAFFVAVEFALIAARRGTLEARAAEGNRRARAALVAIRDVNLQLAGAQLGITMASLGLGFVAEPAIESWIEPILDATGLPHGAVPGISLAITLFLVTTLHIVLGEMVPKNLAIAGPERTLLALAGPYRLYVMIARPLIALTNGAARALLWVIRVEPRDELSEVHTADEIASMVGLSREEGIIEDFAHSLMAGALDLGRRPVSSVMIPHPRVVTVHRWQSVEEVERTVVSSGHSRLPVIGHSIDDIDGFVHAKDMLQLPEVARQHPVPLSIIRRMPVVPVDAALEDALRTMRRSRRHLAVVQGEDGATVGLLSLEDVLEALVGDIQDESDRPRGRRLGLAANRP